MSSSGRMGSLKEWYFILLTNHLPRLAFLIASLPCGNPERPLLLPKAASRTLNRFAALTPAKLPLFAKREYTKTTRGLRAPGPRSFNVGAQGPRNLTQAFGYGLFPGRANR